MEQPTTITLEALQQLVHQIVASTLTGFILARMDTSKAADPHHDAGPRRSDAPAVSPGNERGDAAVYHAVGGVRSHPPAGPSRPSGYRDRYLNQRVRGAGRSLLDAPCTRSAGMGRMVSRDGSSLRADEGPWVALGFSETRRGPSCAASLCTRAYTQHACLSPRARRQPTGTLAL